MRNILLTRRCAILAACLAGACLFMAAPAPAADDLFAKGKGEGLHVGYFNFAPYAFVDSQGKVVGEDVEVLRHVLQQMNVKIADETPTEWAALIPGLTSDRFDVLAAGMYVTPERCKAVLFSEPTFGIQQSLLVAKGNPKGITNYESIKEKGLKIAVISGTAPVTWAKEVGIPDADVVQIPDTPTALAAIQAGRADAYAVTLPEARQIVGALSDPKVEAVKPFADIAGKPASPHGAFAFRKEDAAFVAKFNEALKAFIGSPEHLAIMKTYGLEPDDLPKQTTAQLCGE